MPPAGRFGSGMIVKTPRHAGVRRWLAWADHPPAIDLGRAQQTRSLAGGRRQTG